MGYHNIVVRDGEKRRLRVHSNVPQEVSVSLSRDDVVDAFLVALPVEGMRGAVLGVTD